MSHQRKAKQTLTLIPEDQRPINHRFNVVVVGEQAKDFVQMAVESEMADAYRPKGNHKKLEINLNCPADTEAAKQVVQEQRKPEHQGTHQEEDDQLVIFCPTGADTRELARLRFAPICGFSDSLPLTGGKAANIAANLVVCFLFWKVGQPDHMDTAATISDYVPRMAEIVHAPAGCRPATFILAFETDDAQRKEVNEFAAKQKRVTVTPMFFPDDSVETVMDCFQQVCEAMISIPVMSARSWVSEIRPPPAKSKRACTIC